MQTSIGQTIKTRRKVKGWTADALGREIGRDRQSVYLYERGAEITDVRVLRKLVELEILTAQEAFGEAA